MSLTKGLTLPHAIVPNGVPLKQAPQKPTMKTMKEPIIIRKNPIVIIKDLILLQIVATIAYFLAAVMANYGQWYQTLTFSQITSYEVAKFLFIALSEFLLIAFIFLRWLYTIYIIRPTSVTKERGLFLKKREVIPLKHPISVSYEYAPLSQVFSYGTLIIRSPAREKPIALTHVSNPHLYPRILMELENDEKNEHVGQSPGPIEDLGELLKKREQENLEFKSTFRWDLRENKVNRALEKSAMKTAVAFLNSEGGHMVIGVSDTGTIQGLEHDYITLRKPGADGFENHFTNIFKEMIGPEFRRFLKLSFHKLENKDVCRVRILPATTPAYLRFNEEETFYIRTGNSTTALQISEAATYIRSRWKKY